MPSLSSGINIALQAMLTHSQAVEIIEHNVANANTRGYRRQSPLLSATSAAQVYGYESGMGAGMRGTGVTINRIQRFSLEFFDTRYRSALSDQSNWNKQQEILVQMEGALAETSDDSLLNKLDSFWNGWQNLAADPTNTSLRANVIDESGSLANGFNRRATQLVQLRSDQNQAVGSRVDEMNQLAQQVADLNIEITRVLSINEQPNDLMDTRDQILDRLSQISGAVSNIQRDGSAIVTLGGHLMVMGRTALKIEAVQNPADFNLLRPQWADGQSANVVGGELKGLLTVRDQVIPDQQRALDQAAQTLMTQVNTLHSAGFGLDGNTGTNFFTGTNAFSMKVNPAVTAQNLAVASANGEPANNTIAMQIADLKNSKVMTGGTETINQFYNTTTTRLGFTTQTAKMNFSHQSLVLGSMDTQRESASGVNLDEEATNLVKFQKAYQASARIMTVFDEMMDTIINGMGVGGR